MMRKLLPALMVFGVFLGSAGESFALPECPGSPTSNWSIIKNWTDCFGTEFYRPGEKYVGEWKNGRSHGQGTITFKGGMVWTGIWIDGNLDYSTRKNVTAQKVTPTEPVKKRSLQEAKKECALIGFKIGTEKFGNCVMKLMD